MKITEKPIRKIIVWIMPLFRDFALSVFISSSDIPVIYDIKAGYNGSVHGDTKFKRPAPNARNKFKSANINLDSFTIQSQITMETIILYIKSPNK